MQSGRASPGVPGAGTSWLMSDLCVNICTHVHIGLKELCQEFNSGVTLGSWDYDFFLFIWFRVFQLFYNNTLKIFK